VNIPFVGPDNYKASYEVGKLLAGFLHRGDEVAIIEGLPSADNASQRKAGSLRVIQEEGYKLVASEPANWETADARNAFSRIWSQNPDLKGVFCGNDAMALGVLQEMDIQRKYLPVVGFDNDGVMSPYLRKGQEIGTVDIFSSQMAVEGIRYAIKMISKGSRIYDSYSTPFKIICG
jgi:ribose transport system substrate-binding protein